MSEFTGDNPIMYPGSDVGIGRQAWCAMEAERQMIPFVVAGLALLVLGIVVMLIGRRQARDRSGMTDRTSA